jgi:hypothetical protein
MARRLCAEWQAKWRKRLARFRDRTGTSAEFCQPERFSRSLLSLWSRRVRVPNRSWSQKERDSLWSGTSQQWIGRILPLSESVHRRLRPGKPAFRVVLPNGSRLEVLGRDPEMLRLVVEAVLRQTGPAGEER